MYIPPGLKLKKKKKSIFCPEGAFMFFIWFLEQEVIISLYSFILTGSYNWSGEYLLHDRKRFFNYVLGPS